MTLPTNMTHKSFPADFYWGYATASAQVEGSVKNRIFSANNRSMPEGGADPSGTPFELTQDTVRMGDPQPSELVFTKDGKKTSN